MLRTSKIITNLSVKLSRVCTVAPYHATNVFGGILSTQQQTNTCASTQLQIRRPMTVFTQMGIDQLWEGASAVSNAGKKRGRGKRGASKRRINLYFGKQIGMNLGQKTLHKYPGLNERLVVRNAISTKPTAEVTTISEKVIEDIITKRNTLSKPLRRKKWPMERGWSGHRLPGTSAGPPDPVFGRSFDEFDSRVIEFKMVCHMTGNLGRKMSHSAFVVVGNGTGLVGTSLSKASIGMAAVRKAKNSAVQRLKYIDLRENRTLYHPFFVQEGRTKVFAEPKPPGFGIDAHRCIKTICEVVGIKDIQCKVEGRRKNYRNMTQAFITGLTKQENYQQFADKMGYNVVELTNEHNVPIVLASPKETKTKQEPLEHFDVKRHYHGDQTEIEYGPKKMPYESPNNPSWAKKARQLYKRRNQNTVQLQRLADLLQC